VEKQSLDASLKSENPIGGGITVILLLSLVGFNEYACNSTTEPVKHEKTILPSDRAQFKGGFTCPSDTVLNTFMDTLAHAGSVHDETGELNALQQAHQAGCSDLPLQHVLVIDVGAYRTMSADLPIPAVAPAALPSEPSAGRHQHTKKVELDDEPVVDYKAAALLATHATYEFNELKRQNNAAVVKTQLAMQPQSMSTCGVACLFAALDFEDNVVAYHHRIDARYVPELTKLRTQIQAQRQWLVAHGQSVEQVDQTLAYVQDSMDEIANMDQAVDEVRGALPGLRQQLMSIAEYR
jgi:hypothetical protein